LESAAAVLLRVRNALIYDEHLVCLPIFICFVTLKKFKKRRQVGLLEYR